MVFRKVSKKLANLHDKKCGVLLNIWVAERVVRGDESLHLQLWQPSTRQKPKVSKCSWQPNWPNVCTRRKSEKMEDFQDPWLTPLIPEDCKLSKMRR
jgi:hypothetical protein